MHSCEPESFNYGSKLDLSETCCPKPPIAEDFQHLILESIKYPTGELYTELRSAITDYLGIEECPIVFGNGSAELIDAISGISPYKDVVIVAPTFFLYERAANKYGLRVHYVDYYKHNWIDRILEILRKMNALVWIVNPNNPTAHPTPAALLSSLLSKCECMIAVDESFGDFIQDSFAYRALKSSRVIVIRSFSKAFGLAGARVGYCISNSQNIKEIQSKMDPLSANRIGVILALRCLRQYLEQYQALWKDIVRYIPEFVDILKTEGIEVQSGPCNFVSLRFRTNQAAKSFYKISTDYSILLRPGWHWEFSGDGSRLIRMSIPAYATRVEVSNRLRRVIAVFQERSKSDRLKEPK